MERIEWMEQLRVAVDHLVLPEHRAIREKYLADHGGEVEAACAMLGSYLGDSIERSNEALRSIEQARGQADPKLHAEALSSASEIFERLGRMREALSIDSMKPLLERAGRMSSSESDHAIGSIDEAMAFYDNMARNLAANPRGQINFAKLRESPESNMAVARRTKTLEDGSFFGPLLRCFEQDIGRAERAELIAKMELYVESGHARKDCFDELAADASPAARAMRDLFNERLNSVSPALNDARTREHSANAHRVILDRFDELFVRILVERKSVDTGEDFVLRFKGRNNAEIAKGTSGQVDAAIRDVDDPRVLHCAMATSSANTIIEGDQVLRHGRALSWSAKNGVFDECASTEGVRLVKMSFYSPSSLYDEHDEAKGQRSALGDGLTKLTKDRLSAPEREAINSLPYLSMFRRLGADWGPLRPGLLAGIELRLFGSSQPSWNGAMAQARELPAGVERDRFVVAAAAERIGASIDALSKLKAGPGELETSKAFFKTTITSLADALVGVTRNGINHPEALSAIQSRVGALRSMTSKISGASPLRMEFADMLDKYARPGGIKAWSDLVGAERQYGDALLFKSSAERSADIASTKNFIEQFAEDRSDSATLTALSADVKSDTWAANGFEPDQGAALGRALVQRAARNKLDEQYLDACARGDIELASSMISRGADPEAVDPKGRQAGALCMLGPNRGAAKVLESLVDKTVTARALARLRSTGEFALSF